MHEFILTNIEMIIVLMGVVILALLILLLLNIVRTNNLKEKLAFFMKGKDGVSIEESMAQALDEVARVERDYNQLKRYAKEVIEIKADNGLYKHHMKRYDAFEGMGGQLSFVLVMLDDRNNGFILNNVQGRDNAHMYARNVEEGQCIQRLSPEEDAALAETIAKWSGKHAV